MASSSNIALPGFLRQHRILDDAFQIISHPLLVGTSRRATSTDRLAAIAHLLLLAACGRVLTSAWRWERHRGLRGMVDDVVAAIKSVAFGLALKLPSSRRQVETEMAEARRGLEEKLVPRQLPNGIEYMQTLPSVGRPAEWIEAELSRLKSLEKSDVDEGRVSGAVYHGQPELNELIIGAMGKFVLSNPLHPDVFPGVRKMEAEVVAFCLRLFRAPADGAGTTTSGGTESILMACKAYRDWGRATKGITKPEMVIAASAHAAFYKAADYFGIKLREVAVDRRTRRADVRAMARAINRDTVMIVGSAPNFPDGAVDDIPALAALAQRHKIGLHVDCCLGSFLIPFLRRMEIEDEHGNKIPALPWDVDFAVPGVTSISCDTHKYGFCPKGSSVIMYRSAELRRFQYYVQPDWSGGVYASPSMAGSRPGSIIAGAWAVMTHMGEDGYMVSCEKICGAARDLKRRIRSEFAQDLYVLGDPLVSVVAFGSDSLNIYAIGDRMSKRGWHLSALANPAALHMAVTIPVSRAIDKLIADLHQVVEDVKEAEEAAADQQEAGEKKGDLVALYGLGQTSVGPQLVTQLATMFIDTLYLSR